MTEQVERTAPLGSIRALEDDRDEAVACEEAGTRALAASEIRARARPRTILFVWAWDFVWALIVAVPVWAWAHRAFGGHPDGDALVFRPGGLALMAWLDDDGPAFDIVLRATLISIVAAIVFGQLVTGAIVASLATGSGRRGRPLPLRYAIRAGVRSFVPMLILAVLFGAVEICLFGTGHLVSSSLAGSIQASVGDAHAFSLRLVVLGIFALMASLVGVVGDLARVELARSIAIAPEAEAPLVRHLRDAVIPAFRTARGSVRPAMFGWGWRATIAIVLVYAGAIAGDAVAGRGGAALWLLFAFHQLILLGRAALRTSWLANGLRLVLRQGTT